MEKKRDLYIDFAKGCATLCIIFIHTAFWSGQFYAPTWVRVASLLMDVPLFFALSGLTSGNNIEKTLYRLLRLQITYMIFVTVLFFADYLVKAVGLAWIGQAGMRDLYATFGTKYVPQNISAVPQWATLGNWYVHSYTNCDTFPVVMGSFWYLKVYYILTVFGVLVLRFFPRHVWWFVWLCFGLTVLFNINLSDYPGGQVGYVAFYLGLFLLMSRLRGRKLPGWAVLAGFSVFFLIFGVLLYQLGGAAFLKMNKAKFPPKLLYIFWSSFSILLLCSLYNRLVINKNNWITSVGQNAIFYYFAQGISSSLVYFLVVPLVRQLPWFLLMLIVYIINIALAVGIAACLKQLDFLGWQVLQILRDKTAERVDTRQL